MEKYQNYTIKKVADVFKFRQQQPLSAKHNVANSLKIKNQFEKNRNDSIDLPI